jgi:tape measure domain-containing protein
MSDLASLYIRVDSSGVVTASRDLANFEGVAQKTEGATRKVETATQSMSSSFNKLKSVVAGLVTTYAALQLARFTSDMVMSQVAMERMTVALKAATGSATAAASEMAYIRAESQRLGLSLQDQAKAYTKLAAASKGTSLEGKATRDIFTAISEASTALQLSSDESAGALYAIGQMMSKGTVQAEELRGQLGERLPGAFQVAAKAMGVSTAELGKMLEQGKVMSDDFLPKFAKALHDHYAGAIDDAARSSSANLNRMKTAIFELKVAIGEAFGSSTLGAMQAVTTALEKMKKEMESPEAKEAIAALSAEFEKLVINAGQNAPNAIRKTLEALNGIMTFYNALPPEIVEAAGMGIIGRMLFGAGPGKIIATLSLINSALSRFNMNLGSMVSKYREGSGAFQNVIDVVTGKREWNTGKARGVGINPFNENVMTGKGSSVPGIDMEAIIGPYPKTATATSLGTSASPKLPTGVDKSVSAKAANSAQKLAEEWEKTSKELGLKIDSDGLDEFDSALLKLQYDADKAKKEYEKLPAAIRATAYAKIDAAQQAGINELTTKAAQKDFDEYCKREKEKADLVKKTAAEKLKAERDLYKDLRGYEVEAYDGTIKLIQNQAQKYKDLGIDEVVVKKWAAEETRKAELQKAEYSDDFFEGVRAGYKDIIAHQTKWGSVGLDTVKNFSNKASDTLANVFFDAYKGELKSASKYFKSFGDSMVKTLSDTLSKMIVEAATKQIVMTFGATWSQGAQSVLNVVGKVLGYAADWLFGDSSDAGETISSAWSGITDSITGFASGGQHPGGWRIVGENGPELEYTGKSQIFSNDNTSKIIAAIAGQGKRGDTMLAHVNPAEAALLKSMGGSGTINDRTGLMQFYYDPGPAGEGTYLAGVKRLTESQMMQSLMSRPAGHGIVQLDKAQIATNQNDQWNNYGYYYLDGSGNIQRLNLGTLHADLGRTGPLIGTLTSPMGELYPRIVSQKTASNGNDRYDTYGLFKGDTLVANAGTLHYDVGVSSHLAGQIFSGLTMAVIGAMTGSAATIALGPTVGAGAGTTAGGATGAGIGILSSTGAAVAGGAIGGMTASIPSAIKQKTFWHLLKGALAGAISGGALKYLNSYFAGTTPEGMNPLSSYTMGGNNANLGSYMTGMSMSDYTGMATYLEMASIPTTEEALQAALLKSAKNAVFKGILNKLIGPSGGTLGTSGNRNGVYLAGLSGGDGLMNMIGGIPSQMSNEFAFSADDGGVFSGPASGYSGKLHGTEAVVPLPNGRSIPVDMTGGNKELLEEIKGLRSDLRAGNLAEVKNTGKIMKLLDQVISGSINADGYPAMRTVTA